MEIANLPKHCVASLAVALTTSALGLPASAVESATSTPADRSIECAAAMDFINDAFDSRDFTKEQLGTMAPSLEPVPRYDPQTQTEQKVPIEPESLVWRKQWQGSPPSEDIVTRWYASAARSITECPSISNTWASRRDKAGPPPENLLKQERGNVERSAANISLPVLDSSRTHALILVAVDCPGLCGGSYFVFLKQEAGRWTKVSYHPITQH